MKINATIIAGLLIFITLALTSFSENNSSLYRFIITSLTVTVLVPYALSARVALSGKDKASIKLLSAGLLYSVAVAALFVVLSFLRDILGVLE